MRISEDDGGGGAALCVCFGPFPVEMPDVTEFDDSGVKEGNDDDDV